MDSISTQNPPEPSNKETSSPPDTATTAAGDAPCSGQSPDRHLPTPLMVHVLSFLPPNDLTCSGRAAFKEAWLQLREPHHRTASMRQLLPPHVAVEWAAWAKPAQEALCQLPFNLKVRLLSTAASSGCETNLAVAWELVRPCRFPDANVYLGLFDEHPGGHQERSPVAVPNPGTAAARAGRPELIPWLVQHGCPVDLDLAVVEVAEHCSLRQLQEAIAFVQGRDGEVAAKQCCVFASRGAAACRDHQEALAKVEWLHGLIGTGLGSYIVEAVAAAGNLRLLQWLRAQGCQVGLRSMLAAALESADLGMARWLVEEAGVQLPPSDVGRGCMLTDRMEGSWASLCEAAAASGDVAKLRWLQAWGGTLHKGAICAAVKGGHLEAVHYLHRDCGQRWISVPGLCHAVMAGSTELVEYVLHRDRRFGYFSNTLDLYVAAARNGDVQMIQLLLVKHGELGRRLAEESADSIIDSWAYGTMASAWGCIEVVKSIRECGDEAPFSRCTLDIAASKGDLPLVRYLHQEQRIPFSDNTLARAAEGGCEALLEWLLAEGCPVPGPDNGDSGCDPYVRAFRGYQRSTLVCLMRLGVPWHPDGLARVMFYMPWGKEVPMLQWLVEEGGVPVGPEAVGKALEAARKQRLGGEAVAWLEGPVRGVGAGAE